MTFSPSQSGPYIKGVDSSTSPFNQPKGTVPRASNLIFTERGALDTCDGSGLVKWKNANYGTGLGKILADFLYEPTGVTPYYLTLAQGLDQTLGPPTGLVAILALGGSLAVQPYTYKVTAIDGAGGETSVSNTSASVTPAGSDISVQLTWNVVPNAFQYNVYRSDSGGPYLPLLGTNVPVSQPSPLTTTVTYTDDGTAAHGVIVPINTITVTSQIDTGLGILNFATIITTIPTTVYVGQFITVSGVSTSGFPGFNTEWNVVTASSNSNTVLVGTFEAVGLTVGQLGAGGQFVGGGPPFSDSTSQTVLFKMPAAQSYTNANIVARFPATPTAIGVTQQGNGNASSTPSGGIVGMVSLLPQMVQFTGRIAIALGNGFAPQLYSDSTGSTVNPAFTGSIVSASASGDQVTFTVDGGTTITAINMPVGSNTLINLADTSYNGSFVILDTSVGAGGTFTVRNTTASGITSTGSFTLSTIPIPNTFVPAYPSWDAMTDYATNVVIQPTTQTTPPIYLISIQGGESGASEPSWPTPDPNQPFPFGNISDGTIIWKVAGLLNSAAPPPPGAGHIQVYSGCLWFLDTYPSNTATGIDGPCALRMSDVNNPLSYNPVNAAFLDKDDGTEGMALGVFTISAQGIPPEGTLCAFKFYASYQIIGVFGSSNFAIQRIKTTMGCTSPRSLQFVPGFGLGRNTHLGISVFDGVDDRVISEQVRPYLFPVNDPTISDIVPADPAWVAASWGSMTANPPMYTVWIPVGNSGGKLTRGLSYDLVLKAWAIIDLPFSISTATQVLYTTTNPLTILGGFQDGLIQQWQAGDVRWLNGTGADVQVAWSFRTPTTSSKNPDQRLFCQETVIKGIASNALGPITCIPRVDGVAQYAMVQVPAPTGDLGIFYPIQITGNRFDAIFSGAGGIEVVGVDFHVVGKNLSAPLVIA